MKAVENGITAPKGFLAGAVHCGIRKNTDKKDLAVIYSEVPANAAAVYTQNIVVGAPLTVTKEHIADGKAQLIICNSGNANTCNPDGIQVANEMSELIAQKFGLAKQDIIIASTGVIGQSLDVSKIAKGIEQLTIDKDGSVDAAQAIMTTDLVMKEVAYEFEIGGKTCTIGAIAKGSGMIHPNMATMLGFVTTDVSINSDLLKAALEIAVSTTYNMISVDGDTSTNDMVAVLANGCAENEYINGIGEDFDKFVEALTEVSLILAKQIAKDGEGASKLVAVTVEGANTTDDAIKLSKSVVTSSLVKTAVYGNDANWGRILCALGYAGAPFKPEEVNVTFKSNHGEILICENGATVSFDEAVATHILNTDEVHIHIEINEGDKSATAYGCDLTEQYVEINGSYRS
ncbi:MAG: bifunctional ornithine acetyltransferase/N-acetylglutamate synthase [Epulopiscium sp. Nele67-Bin004]|nr:MAG: bifunctional ornithine acetyltransferase/N-acetylglutamate synthase [Epulopiscium sp. Nele67-Bin004]